MGSCKSPHVVLLLYVLVCFVYQSFAFGVDTNQTAKLLVDASEASGRPISETMFGIFFEEINHAGAGGLWAELVSNRGFEAGGPNVPSNIDPWSIIGNESSLIVSTDRSSCFDRNKVALRMEVLCDSQGASSCPDDGVGIYNPGFWGMLKLWMLNYASRAVATLAPGRVDGRFIYFICLASGSEVSNLTKFEFMLEAQGTNPNSRLQLTTTRKGLIWFDQVSVMPLDTYKGHGFRNDLVQMLEDLKPQFLRFPGGCFVQGAQLRNAFRWKETIGPWEERPGHFGDVWMYWTDDGLGYFEFLRLAEDLGTLPIWVFNSGISLNEQVDTSSVLPFVQEALDGLEFARGNPNSTWGSLRAAMGHPEPFDLRYVAVGNEDCVKENYRGNYLKFYSAIKRAYPDIKIISNCDGSSQKLDHPADLFDFHFYADDPKNMFSMAHHFDHTSRSGPKAFVSEYAVTTGSLLAALGEAGFLIGLEKNSDVVEMASYAPLFANDNGRNSKFSAIVFNSSHLYGTPSYWMQCLFKESSGATIFNATLQTNSSTNQVEQLLASAISWKNSENENSYLRIKIVNFGTDIVNLKIVVDGLEPNSINLSESTKTVLTSNNPMDENSLNEPKKVIPNRIPLEKGGEDVEVAISPNSFTSIDFLIESS
ncbi:alpha-L-arabinofuranosidase 1-like [Prunus avium]|uniref:non-reducing end alpha-L-arabinofuranosidase n=1 Tax=Prunus avium TaxID=42229 RepID=A0A6P5TX35_PRUAV|nr:alpha-L-arabinofuranosidase 1-like [Prunus avium]